jgi:GNAT superfamily N-acetyltransferase
MLNIRKVRLNEEITQLLIGYSAEWEQEDCCYGYRQNTVEDLAGKTVYVAYHDGSAAGYLFGHPYTADQNSCTIPDGSRCFEVDELFVDKPLRCRGIGKRLFAYMEQDQAGKCEYICLSTAARNSKAVLHFYLDEVGMTFWSARLFKQLKPSSEGNQSRER